MLRRGIGAPLRLLGSQGPRVSRRLAAAHAAQAHRRRERTRRLVAARTVGVAVLLHGAEQLILQDLLCLPDALRRVAGRQLHVQAPPHCGVAEGDGADAAVHQQPQRLRLRLLVAEDEEAIKLGEGSTVADPPVRGRYKRGG